MPGLPQIPEGAKLDPRGQSARDERAHGDDMRGSQAPWTTHLPSAGRDDALTPHPDQYETTPNAEQKQKKLPDNAGVSSSSLSLPSNFDKWINENRSGGPSAFDFDHWFGEFGMQGLAFPGARPPPQSGIPIHPRTRQFLGLDDNTPRASQYDATPRASHYNATPRASQYNTDPSAHSLLHRFGKGRPSLPNVPSTGAEPIGPRGSSWPYKVARFNEAGHIDDARIDPSSSVPESSTSPISPPRRPSTPYHAPAGHRSLDFEDEDHSHSRSTIDPSAPLVSPRNIPIPASTPSSRHSSQRSASSFNSLTSGLRSPTSSSAAGSTRSRVVNFFSRHDNTSQHSLHATEYTPDDPEYWIANAGTRFREMGPDDPPIELGISPHFIQSVPHVMHDVAKTSKLRITVNINRVLLGTWQGEQAVFVGLTVSHQSSRVIETDVTIKVAPGGLGDLTMEQYESSRVMEEPVIRQFAPKTHYGIPTQVNQSTTVGVSANLSPTTPIGSVGNVSGSASRTTDQLKEQRHTVTGYSSSERRESNRTIFNLNAIENASDEKGIESELHIGLVIETRNKPIVLAVDVKSRLPPADIFTMFRNKYSWSVPVYIDWREWPGDPLPKKMGKEISEWDPHWDWKKLVPYSGFIENELVGS